MAEFLFGSWPEGVGPLMVQLVLIVGGVAGGIRVVDDVREWRTAKARDDSRG